MKKKKNKYKRIPIIGKIIPDKKLGNKVRFYNTKTPPTVSQLARKDNKGRRLTIK